MRSRLCNAAHPLTFVSCCGGFRTIVCMQGMMNMMMMMSMMGGMGGMGRS
jgi:hypothetical protein